MGILSKGNLFDNKLVSDLVVKINGRSSLAALSARTPIAFNGNKEFVFSMDSEIDIVAENAPKSHGGVTMTPQVIVPLKVEYGARVSDEFIYAAEEDQINILKAFNEGFAIKVARGLDLMAMHGINPRSGTPSALIGTNHFDSKVTQTVTTTADPDADIETAVALVQGASGTVNGMAMSPAYSAALAKLKVNGVKQFAELAWGANPGSLNGLKLDINETVSANSSKDRVILGNFASMFRWGYAKEVPFEIIKFGDPDNTSKDLRGHNQVYLRAELFLGWGIMDGASFARIVTA